MKQVLVTYRDPAKAAPYAAALRMAGVEPVLVSPDDPRALGSAAGLLLTGGTDVNPALYLESRHPLTQPPDEARDAMEISLLRSALDEDVPVLAICRGMQLLNVAHGGTLTQHVDGHSIRTPDPSAAIHDVMVQPDTLLFRILGRGPCPVNSRHHQVIAKPGEALVATARSKDDAVVEALERPDRRFVLGVQWHPEDQAPNQPAQRRLFEAFAESLAIKRGIY